MLTRRFLLLTTALVPAGVLPQPHPAAAHGLAPVLEASGRETVWINPSALAALRRAVGAWS